MAEYNKADYEAQFAEWLAEEHPDVLQAALEYIAERPGWNLDDGVDAIDLKVYNHWCEIEI